MTTFYAVSEPHTRDLVCTFVFVEQQHDTVDVYKDQGVFGAKHLGRQRVDVALMELPLDQCVALATEFARHPSHTRISVTEEHDAPYAWELRCPQRIFRVVCEIPLHDSKIQAIGHAWLRPEHRGLWWDGADIQVASSLDLHSVLDIAHAHPTWQLLDRVDEHWLLQRPLTREWIRADADVTRALEDALHRLLLTRYVLGDALSQKI